MKFGPSRPVPALAFLLGVFSVLIAPGPARADLVKPALVEISVFSEGQFRVEIRASVEALLTGINGRYRNTKEAPNAAEYDRLRKMSSADLHEAFEPFKQRLLDSVELKFNGERAQLHLQSVDIPPTGYTKVPRISLIVLTGEVPASAQKLTWYYPLAFGDNAVRVRQVNQAKKQWHWSPHQWIRTDTASEPFSLSEVYAKRPIAEIVLSYIVIGFEHIIPMGTDHILFILGVFLLSARLKPLLTQVTMFTLAHTLTLGLATSGYIELSPRIVEPLIALSIAYVGVENIWTRKLHRSRIALVFAFGLLHGLGFAGALADFGMPPHAFFPALISFNVGVELGQLCVLLVATVLVAWPFSHKPWYHQRVIVPASLMIGVTGLYWAIDRLEWLS